MSGKKNDTVTFKRILQTYQRLEKAICQIKQNIDEINKTLCPFPIKIDVDNKDIHRAELDFEECFSNICDISTSNEIGELDGILNHIINMSIKIQNKINKDSEYEREYNNIV